MPATSRKTKYPGPWLKPLPLPLPLPMHSSQLRLPMWQFVLVRGWPKLMDSFGAPTAAQKVNAEGAEVGGQIDALTIWLKFNKLYEMLS